MLQQTGIPTKGGEGGACWQGKHNKGNNQSCTVSSVNRTARQVRCKGWVWGVGVGWSQRGLVEGPGLAAGCWGAARDWVFRRPCMASGGATSQVRRYVWRWLYVCVCVCVCVCFFSGVVFFLHSSFASSELICRVCFLLFTSKKVISMAKVAAQRTGFKKTDVVMVVVVFLKEAPRFGTTKERSTLHCQPLTGEGRA